VREQRHLFEAMRRGRGLDLLLEKAQVYWSKRAEARLQSLLPSGQTPAVPLSIVASYVSGALSTFLRWWMDNQSPYSAERMDEMFQQVVMPGVWAALGKDGTAKESYDS